jgi:hypothetical protein
MHFIYAYVDISWEAQSMIYVGAMMGLLNSMERIVAGPIPHPRKNWSRQPLCVLEAKPQPLQKGDV